jgi:hypothetical protein
MKNNDQISTRPLESIADEGCSSPTKEINTSTESLSLSDSPQNKTPQKKHTPSSNPVFKALSSLNDCIENMSPEEEPEENALALFFRKLINGEILTAEYNRKIKEISEKEISILGKMTQNPYFISIENELKLSIETAERLAISQKNTSTLNVVEHEPNAFEVENNLEKARDQAETITRLKKENYKKYLLTDIEKSYEKETADLREQQNQRSKLISSFKEISELQPNETLKENPSLLIQQGFSDLEKHIQYEEVPEEVKKILNLIEQLSKGKEKKEKLLEEFHAKIDAFFSENGELPRSFANVLEGNVVENLYNKYSVEVIKNFIKNIIIDVLINKQLSMALSYKNPELSGQKKIEDEFNKKSLQIFEQLKKVEIETLKKPCFDFLLEKKIRLSENFDSFKYKFSQDKYKYGLENRERKITTINKLFLAEKDLKKIKNKEQLILEDEFQATYDEKEKEFIKNEKKKIYAENNSKIMAPLEKEAFERAESQFIEHLKKDIKNLDGYNLFLISKKPEELFSLKERESLKKVYFFIEKENGSSELIFINTTGKWQNLTIKDQIILNDLFKKVRSIPGFDEKKSFKELLGKELREEFSKIISANEGHNHLARESKIQAKKEVESSIENETVKILNQPKIETREEAKSKVYSKKEEEQKEKIASEYKSLKEELKNNYSEYTELKNLSISIQITLEKEKNEEKISLFNSLLKEINEELEKAQSVLHMISREKLKQLSSVYNNPIVEIFKKKQKHNDGTPFIIDIIEKQKITQNGPSLSMAIKNFMDDIQKDRQKNTEIKDLDKKYGLNKFILSTKKRNNTVKIINFLKEKDTLEKEINKYKEKNGLDFEKIKSLICYEKLKKIEEYEENIDGHHEEIKIRENYIEIFNKKNNPTLQEQKDNERDRIIITERKSCVKKLNHNKEELAQEILMINNTKQTRKNNSPKKLTATQELETFRQSLTKVTPEELINSSENKTLTKTIIEKIQKFHAEYSNSSVIKKLLDLNESEENIKKLITCDLKTLEIFERLISEKKKTEADLVNAIKSFDDASLDLKKYVIYISFEKKYPAIQLILSHIETLKKMYWPFDIPNSAMNDNILKSFFDQNGNISEELLKVLSLEKYEDKSTLKKITQRMLWKLFLEEPPAKNFFLDLFPTNKNVNFHFDAEYLFSKIQNSTKENQKKQLNVLSNKIGITLETEKNNFYIEKLNPLREKIKEIKKDIKNNGEFTVSPHEIEETIKNGAELVSYCEKKHILNSKIELLLSGIKKSLDEIEKFQNQEKELYSSLKKDIGIEKKKSTILIEKYKNQKTEIDENIHKSVTLDKLNLIINSLKDIKSDIDSYKKRLKNISISIMSVKNILSNVEIDVDASENIESFCQDLLGGAPNLAELSKIINTLLLDEKGALNENVLSSMDREEIKSASDKNNPEFIQHLIRMSYLISILNKLYKKSTSKFEPRSFENLKLLVGKLSPEYQKIKTYHDRLKSAQDAPLDNGTKMKLNFPFLSPQELLEKCDNNILSFISKKESLDFLKSFDVDIEIALEIGEIYARIKNTITEKEASTLSDKSIPLWKRLYLVKLHEEKFLSKKNAFEKEINAVDSLLKTVKKINLHISKDPSSELKKTCIEIAKETLASLKKNDTRDNIEKKCEIFYNKKFQAIKSELEEAYGKTNEAFIRNKCHSFLKEPEYENISGELKNHIQRSLESLTDDVFLKIKNFINFEIKLNDLAEKADECKERKDLTFHKDQINLFFEEVRKCTFSKNKEMLDFYEKQHSNLLSRMQLIVEVYEVECQYIDLHKKTQLNLLTNEPPEKVYADKIKLLVELRGDVKKAIKTNFPQEKDELCGRLLLLSKNIPSPEKSKGEIIFEGLIADIEINIINIPGAKEPWENIKKAYETHPAENALSQFLLDASNLLDSLQKNTLEKFTDTIYFYIFSVDSKIAFNLLCSRISNATKDNPKCKSAFEEMLGKHSEAYKDSKTLLEFYTAVIGKLAQYNTNKSTYNFFSSEKQHPLLDKILNNISSLAQGLKNQLEPQNKNLKNERF